MNIPDIKKSTRHLSKLRQQQVRRVMRSLSSCKRTMWTITLASTRPCAIECACDGARRLNQPRLMLCHYDRTNCTNCSSLMTLEQVIPHYIAPAVAKSGRYPSTSNSVRNSDIATPAFSKSQYQTINQHPLHSYVMPFVRVERRNTAFFIRPSGCTSDVAPHPCVEPDPRESQYRF
jgi:hypothetical protein